MGKVRMQLQQIFKTNHYMHLNKVCTTKLVQWAIQQTYGMRGIVVFNLLCKTTLGALKYIDTISPKEYEFLGNLVSW